MSDRKTINVDASTHERLADLKDEGQSFDGLLNALAAGEEGRRTADELQDAVGEDGVELSDDAHRNLVDDVGAEVEGRVRSALSELRR